MTELATYEPPPVAVGRYTPPDVSEWESLVRQCDVLAKSGLMPKALSGKPMAVFAVVLAGREQGLTPMKAIAELFVVDGKVGSSAQLMRARILEFGHELWCESADETQVTMCGRRRGEDRVHRATFTFAEAQKAGLTGKSNWSNYRVDMLTARASARLGRLAFADVLLGCAYLTDELGADSPAWDNSPALAIAPAAQDAEHAHGDDDGNRMTHSHPGGALDHTHEAPAAAKPLPGYSPDADLGRFDEGADWTAWAGAGDAVRRRSPKQAAADRLMVALQAGDPRVVDPRVRDFADIDRIAAGPQIVDGQVDIPAADSASAQVSDGAGGDTPEDVWDDAAAQAATLAVEQPALPTPEDLLTASPLMSAAEIAAAMSTTSSADVEADPASEVTLEPANDESGQPIMPAAKVEVETLDVATGEAARTAESVLADIDQAADILGTNRSKLLIRLTLAHRCNPEEIPVDALLAFLDGIMPEVERKIAEAKA